MTPCNFQGSKAKIIQANFDGGAVLLREIDTRVGLIDAVNDCIPDPRNPFFIAHTQRSMLAQRIIAITQGYEDLNDHQTLRDDPLFQVATERGVNVSK